MFKFLILTYFITVIAQKLISHDVKQKLSPLKINSRIIGGNEVNIEDIPYQVSLQTIDIKCRTRHICGGTLIAKNYVLTAAHCMINSDKKSFVIRIGSKNVKNGGILVKVQEIFIHSNYTSPKFDYDFSILKLDDWDTTNIIHGFVKLPEENEDIPDDEQLTVSGWGLTKLSFFPSFHRPQNLHAVKVLKFNQKECTEMYRKFVRIGDDMICARDCEKDSCSGDSGGPLTSFNETRGHVLVGIVSFGKHCGKYGYPGVYGRVSVVRNWIKDISGV